MSLGYCCWQTGRANRVGSGRQENSDFTISIQSGRPKARCRQGREAKYWEMAYEGIKAHPGKVVVGSNELAGRGQQRKLRELEFSQSGAAGHQLKSGAR